MYKQTSCSRLTLFFVISVKQWLPQTSWSKLRNEYFRDFLREINIPIRINAKENILS
jgi:hypothetical protein